jgi:hypothetical protein
MPFPETVMLLTFSITRRPSMRVILTATALIITLATQVLSEPSKNMRILMDSNVSILDWGMFKIDRELEKNGDLLHRFNLDHWVTYDWENDKIRIVTHTFAVTTKTMEEAEVQCKEIFTVIDRVFLIKDGKDMFVESCQICDAFGHEGWSKSNLKKASLGVKDKFELISVNSRHRCSRKLYGAAVTVSKVRH